jgi:hypothetical protein
MDAKKLMNQKNYIMKHKQITEMEIEDIKRKMQASQRSQLAEGKEGKLVHKDIINDEHKPNVVSTTEEETGSQQHRDQINKQRQKIERK